MLKVYRFKKVEGLEPQKGLPLEIFVFADSQQNAMNRLVDIFENHWCDPPANYYDLSEHEIAYHQYFIINLPK